MFVGCLVPQSITREEGRKLMWATRDQAPTCTAILIHAGMRSIHSPPSVIMWIFTREPCGMAGEPSACVPKFQSPVPPFLAVSPSH